VPPPSARPAASKATNSVKAASSSKALAVSPTEPVKYKYSAEEALAKAADDVPQTYHIKLADAAWKTRLEAAEELVTWLSGEGANEIESEVLFRFLCKIPGWSEKNFQVSAKIYNAMAIMAERSSSFGRSSAALVIGPLSDKLGDMKLKKPSGDALVVFAEKTSLAFVLAQGESSSQSEI
jgi:cytoskeleton-associated protein 5